MAGHLLSLYTATRASMLNRLSSNLPLRAIRRLRNQGRNGSGEGQGMDKERARTMAEEFERVAEEKSGQGFSSQTIEKARDAAEEATIRTSQPESVKEAYKESPHTGADFHKKG